MAKAHYEIVEHDGGWAYRLRAHTRRPLPPKPPPKQPLIMPPPSKSCRANPKTSRLRTARADDIPSTRQAMTGLTRMWASPRSGR